MKQLAAQSKALALRTWRDGVDMRAMAVITLITLPGTFTAVSKPLLQLRQTLSLD